METLHRRPEWGTPQADEIIYHIANDLEVAGVKESYDASLQRTRQQLIEADRLVPPKRRAPYDGSSIDEVLASELPLLPVGLERDDLLDPFHTIASIALVKVNPVNGEILNGSFKRFIADVHEDGFGRIDPDFDESKAAVILQKAIELRYVGLYPRFGPW